VKKTALPEPADILKLFSAPSYRPMRRSELYRRFQLHGDQTRELRRLLRDMEREGAIARVKGGRYALPRDSGTDIVTGRIEVHHKGFGFVTPSGGGDDIYIHGDNMSNALHGDTVAVRLVAESRRKGRRPRREGKITQIIQRGNDAIVGVLEKRGKSFFVTPDNPRIQRDVYVASSDAANARPGQKVVAKITDWEGKHTNPRGTISEVLGDAGDPRTDLLAIIYSHQLPVKFPASVVGEADRISRAPVGKAIAGREDLRGAVTFTIDPPDARDFDDAVSLTREGHNLVLGVHIADVSHYVTPGSIIDNEARERATSVYFPSRVLPMLPESLSNGVCSLRENEDRLTHSVFITFAPGGRAVRCRFADSVIRSRKRFTYQRVSSLLRGEAGPSDKTEETILPILKEMESLALTLRAGRFRRGALDLDMPEAVIEFDREGMVAGVRREEFDNSHILIEEFMIAANEAVGAHIASMGAPALWRVHEDPDEDALYEYLELIKPFGYSIRDIHDKRAIQKFLDLVKGKPEAYALQLAFLRSLKLAIYSTRNMGHYGLGSKNYLYFTSPIRRYPDLVTHRTLRAMRSGRRERFPLDIEELAAHCSDAEERAEDAERECVKLRKLQYLKEHLDRGEIDVLPGVITSIREFGFSVYLNDYLLEGMVHVSSLSDDFYRISRNRAQMVGERTRRRFRVGDIVTVQVARVDFLKKEADFVVADRRGLGKGVVPHATERGGRKRYPRGGRGQETRRPGQVKSRKDNRGGRRTGPGNRGRRGA